MSLLLVINCNLIFKTLMRTSHRVIQLHTLFHGGHGSGSLEHCGIRLAPQAGDGLQLRVELHDENQFKRKEKMIGGIAVGGMYVPEHQPFRRSSGRQE